MASQNLQSALAPLTRRPIQTSLAAILTTTVLTWSYLDYRAYIALGPGGVPHNWFGWLAVTLFIRPFALSKSSATYTGDYPSEGGHEEMKNLPERKGERAEIGGIVPHRQLSQHAPEHMRESIQNLFANIVTANPATLESKRSLYERHNPALFVSPSLLSSPAAPSTAKTARGEIGHHHGDMSVHLYLSPADARLAIEKGWAERHRLSVPRTSWFANRYHVADSYVLVYGPRDEGEMEVLATILRCSARFMTGREVERAEWRQIIA
ncbi:hypothetical protein Cob_v008128 [Colletotrichum orbiculare MAFF 240422]|uniref:Luciferase domain-containing protein n=1 Tax=Colletotrichum orbiculare (strain 104-T / ATCC 96160 / CBS 514.97 / LARS 414 / MAFF 240422) TaxID=1213857 RepID=N4VVA8_COLOR|nr:hypothetical protein Cob_v008128 [Colletotrichum orbiculare MAFF 240422]